VMFQWVNCLTQYTMVAIFSIYFYFHSVQGKL
jgi:hypothetical protein